MADRIKILLQKRMLLKSQIMDLSNILDKGRVDNVLLKFWMKRLTDSFHAFKKNNNALAVLNPNEAYYIEFVNVQERYYSLAARISCMQLISKTSTGWLTNETRITRAPRS